PQMVTTVPVDEEVRLVHDLLDKLAGHALEERFRKKIEIELEGAEHADRRLSHALSEESTTYAALRRATVTWLLQERAADAAAGTRTRGTPPAKSSPSRPPAGSTRRRSRDRRR